MENNVLDRIIGQQINQTPSHVIPQATTIDVSAAIEPESLRQMLLLAFNGPIITKEMTELHFENLYDFVPWYVNNRLKFSEGQRKALDTLDDTRRMIDSGCACKRHSRDIQAHQYFEQFWLRNKETDMLQTIAGIANVDKVSVNHFCSYTRAS